MAVLFFDFIALVLYIFGTLLSMKTIKAQTEFRVWRWAPLQFGAFERLAYSRGLQIIVTGQKHGWFRVTTWFEIEGEANAVYGLMNEIHDKVKSFNRGQFQ